MTMRKPSYFYFMFCFSCLGLVLSSCETPRQFQASGLETVSLDRRITLSSDDAEEYSNGSVTRSSTRLELTTNPSNGQQTIGLRFSNITIPAGASISQAYLQFTAASSSSAATNLTIQTQAAAHPATFSSTSFNISSRPRSLKSISWQPVAWTVVGESGSNQKSPDLSALIQERVNESSWQSGNALAFIITGSGQRNAWAFDGNNAAAPRLQLEYQIVTNPPKVDSFSATPAIAEAGQAVTFTWAVSDLEGQTLGCTLDVDGNNSSDYSFSDCLGSTSQSHVYASPGNYQARLIVTDSDGAVATASSPVIISTSVTLATVGDIACNPTSSKFNGGLGTTTLPFYCHMLATSDQVLAIDPDAVLVLGDLQYQEGTLEQFYGSYDLSWGRFKDITYPVIGNHEYLTPDAAGYFGYFGEAAGDPTKAYYSFDLGNWHIIVLAPR
jgi:hypothetical protein